jgi:WD40 repeat protein
LTLLTNVGAARVAFISTNGLLAVASSDAAAQAGVTLWDVNAGTVVKRLPHPARIRSLATSPDGKLLATFDNRGNITVVDWMSDCILTNLLVPQPRYGNAGVVAFSPDGTRLAIGEDHGRTRLLDLLAGATTFLPTQLGVGVTALAFSSEGDLLATGYGYGKGTIDLWDARSGAHRGQLTNHTDSVNALAFTPDGGRLASASEDGTLRLWNVTNRTQVASLQSSYEREEYLSVLPDGETVVSGGRGGSVCVWDVTTARRAPLHTPMTVSPGFASLAEVEASGYTPRNLDPRVPRRSGFAFTPDSRHFIGVDTNGALALWETYPIRVIEQLTALGSNHWGTALSPDGHWLVTGDDIGRITIWDWPARQAVTNFALPFEYWGVLRFTRHGHHLSTFIVRNDHSVSVKLWRTADWSEVPLTGTQFANVSSVDLSPDDRWLAAGYVGGQVKLFGLPFGEPEVSLGRHNSGVISVLFLPKGDFLVSTSTTDGSTCLWDLATRRPCASFGGQSGFVFGTALSPDGRRLATSGGEAIKVWDLVAQRELVTLQGEGQFFINPGFSPDGNTLTATAVSGTAHLWHAPSWEEIEAAESRRKPR